MPTSQYSEGGRNAVVTGASRGIGRTIAERFAADGANVAICSRARADRTGRRGDRRRPRGPGGGEATAMLDHLDRASVYKFLRTPMARVERADFLGLCTVDTHE